MGCYAFAARGVRFSPDKRFRPCGGIAKRRENHITSGSRVMEALRPLLMKLTG